YGPSQDWLKITKSSKAKNKIKQYFKKQRREENVEKGKKEIEQIIIDMGLQPKEVLTERNLSRVLERCNLANEIDMYAAVGYQGITAALIVTRLTDEIRKEKETEQKFEEAIEKIQSSVQEKKLPKSDDQSGIVVEGVDNILVRLSKCCNP